MRMLIAIAIVSVGGLASAVDRPVLTGREAPRATDLLRAETLAKKARDRLRVPAHASAAWKKGGTGWSSPAASAPPDGDPGRVSIRVSPPRRPRRTTP